jgi:hypothetical protein
MKDSNLYYINLNDLINLQDIKSFSIYEILSDTYENVAHISKNALREIIRNNKNQKNRHLFYNVEHESFLTCLINSFALIDSFEIENILNHYKIIYDEKNKKEEFINYIKSKYEATLNQYAKSLPNIHIKIAIIHNWLRDLDKNDENDHIEISLDMSEYKVNEIVDKLIYQKALLLNEKQNAKDFFLGKDVEGVRFETSSTLIFDLFLRIKFKRKLSNKEIAKLLCEKVFYKNKKSDYKRINFSYCKNELSQVKTNPPSDRLLIKEFPEPETH